MIASHRFGGGKVTFEQLSYFIATYEEGSFAMAAARLFNMSLR